MTNKNQDNLIDYINDKFVSKKDLNRKAASFAVDVLTPKSLDRFKDCATYVAHMTNESLSVKKIAKSNQCGNRFCPICTWSKAKKDSLKIKILTKVILEKQELIFLTLSAPNVKGEDLKNEIDRFNHAYGRLFKKARVIKAIKGYIRKLEVTYNGERFITDDMMKNPKLKNYLESKSLSVGDNNPNYDTYNPHFHVLMSVNKSYFTNRDYIKQEEWLEMWQSAMKDDLSIKILDVRKVRKDQKSQDGAVVEVAKYTAKGNDLYHSKDVFEVFYKALKGRQFITYQGIFKEYAKKYENGELDEYKENDENVYTHILDSVWQKSKYKNMLREMSADEFLKYNEQAKKIEEKEVD